MRVQNSNSPCLSVFCTPQYRGALCFLNALASTSLIWRRIPPDLQPRASCLLSGAFLPGFIKRSPWNPTSFHRGVSHGKGCRERDGFQALGRLLLGSLERWVRSFRKFHFWYENYQYLGFKFWFFSRAYLLFAHSSSLNFSNLQKFG